MCYFGKQKDTWQSTAVCPPKRYTMIYKEGGGLSGFNFKIYFFNKSLFIYAYITIIFQVWCSLHLLNAYRGIYSSCIWTQNGWKTIQEVWIDIKRKFKQSIETNKPSWYFAPLCAVLVPQLLKCNIPSHFCTDYLWFLQFAQGWPSY